MGDSWWKGGVIYQVYPRSYADTDGDGVGDLPGITAHLSHIAALGADAVWISPFFKSPMADYGYDVSDYCAVDPLFGTNEDFMRLLETAHGLGLKVVLDLVLSHTSDQHPWFTESRQSRDNAKADWYVWADPRPDGSPPNNWQAHFGGPSWHFDIRRGQYYLHNFLPEQPDLNLRCPGARQAVLDATRFWLDAGVDGFRLDAALHYFCDPAFKDNPVNPRPFSSWFEHPAPFSMQHHVNDIHLPDSLAFMEEFRALLDEYDDRAAFGEIGGENGIANLALYTAGEKRLHTAYSFALATGTAPSAARIRGAVESFLAQPDKGWPSWAFSNHDVPRVASRWHEAGEGWGQDPRFSQMLVALLCSLYGTPFLYQGEELGLPEAVLAFEQIRDPMGKFLWPHRQGRDGSRTPMPWDGDAPHAGFAPVSATPWLPVPAAHLPLSVAAQEKDADSTLHFTRSFLRWRKTRPALIQGGIAFPDTGEDDRLIAFTRGDGARALLCAFNLEDKEKRVVLPGFAPADGGSVFADGPAGRAEGGVLVLPPYGFFYAESSPD